MIKCCIGDFFILFFGRNGVEDRNHIFFQCDLEKFYVVDPPVILLIRIYWRKKNLLAYMCGD